MKTQIFPFWHNFYDDLKFYTQTKFYEKQLTSSWNEINPIAMLRAHKGKKPSPQKASIVLLNCLFQLPFPRAFLLSVAKCWKGHLPYHHSELSSPHPSPLVTAVALEPGVGPITSQLPIWLLSWINCFNYTLQGCFTQISRQDFLCMFLFLHPCHHPPALHPGHLRSSFLFLVVYI